MVFGWCALVIIDEYKIKRINWEAMNQKKSLRPTSKIVLKLLCTPLVDELLT